MSLEQWLYGSVGWLIAIGIAVYSSRRIATLTKASRKDVDAGTDDDKAVTPRALRESQYRRIYSGTGPPSDSDWEDGDIYVQHSE